MPGRGERGFSLLEAVAALVILGLTGVAALAALGAELRTADRVNRSLPAVALTRDRLTAIRLLPPEAMERLPDSLSQGTFAPPFEEYRWEAASRAVPEEEGLFDISVTVSWDDGFYPLQTRLYRPARQLRFIRRGGPP